MYIPRSKIAGTCLTCGKLFVGRASKRFCKATCLPSYKKANKERKRLRKRNKRIPKWVKMKDIEKIYDNRPEGMVVDHVIPLNHPDISGLHVPANLQYLTPKENAVKSNSWDGSDTNEGWRKLLAQK